MWVREIESVCMCLRHPNTYHVNGEDETCNVSIKMESRLSRLMHKPTATQRHNTLIMMTITIKYTTSNDKWKSECVTMISLSHLQSYRIAYVHGGLACNQSLVYCFHPDEETKYDANIKSFQNTFEHCKLNISSSLCLSLVPLCELLEI